MHRRHQNTIWEQEDLNDRDLGQQEDLNDRDLGPALGIIDEVELDQFKSKFHSSIQRGLAVEKAVEFDGHLTKEGDCPDSQHPYLQQILTLTTKFEEEDYSVAYGTSEFRRLHLEMALLQLNPHREFRELFLVSMENVMWMLGELPDDITKHDGEDFGRLEYPNLYLLLDDPGELAFTKALKFLRKQKTLSFTLHTAPDRCCNVTSQPVCAAFATARYTFLLDCQKLGQKKISGILKAILEDPSIHKVVYDCTTYTSILQDFFETELSNFYDVVRAERSLNGTSSCEKFTFRQFQRRYKTVSRVFGTFPEKNFLSTCLPDVHSTIRAWPTADLENLLKQIVYLALAKNCQIARLMEDAISETETAMRKFYFYQRDWEFAETLQDNQPSWGLVSPNTATKEEKKETSENGEEVEVSILQSGSEDDPDEEEDGHFFGAEY